MYTPKSIALIYIKFFNISYFKLQFGGYVIMFVGFNLKLNDSDIDEKYYQIGKAFFENLKIESKKSIDNFIDSDGIINANELEKNWFNSLDADVFISHSHMDEKLIIKLAGLLKSEYGLNCFVDSCVWGYANEILKGIDDKYCKNIKNKDGTYSYNYNQRNNSTSHIHLILNGAIAKMINHSECLIFVNTPNSIKISDINNPDKTDSPWIYSELLMATEFPKQKLQYYRSLQHSNFSYNINESLRVRYDVNIDKLYKLTLNDLLEAGLNGNKKTQFLDALYSNKKIL